MTPETLQAFLKGLMLLNLKLSSRQIEQFSIYLNELKNWNSKFNLIGPATDEEIITRHFLDSLSVVSALHNNCTALSACRVLDIGTGAGFPGIPIKIAKPEISLTLLDSSRKKTEFLRHLVKKLNIDTGIFCGRAEDVAKLSTHRERYNTVVARAVAKLSTLEKLCFPFLSKNGVIILQLSKKTDIILRSGKIMNEFNPPSKILPGRTILTIRKKQNGFTLIELMIVVTIIGILAAIAIPKFGEVLKRTKQGKTKGELGRLRSALTLYYGVMEGAMYPQNAAAVLSEAGPVQTKYLSKMPTVKLGPGTHGETTSMDDFNVGEALTDVGNWGYISNRGSVFINCTHLDAAGKYTSSW